MSTLHTRVQPVLKPPEQTRGRTERPVHARARPDHERVVYDSTHDVFVLFGGCKCTGGRGAGIQ
jgi:hypothetical protein